MLSIVQTKTQEQGLTGYSSVLLTSRASHRLGKCWLSWVWLAFWLLSALSECNACSGRGSHRHASSGFVSVQTHQTAQSWHDLVRTSVFLFTLIVLFSEEFLLHSSGHAVLVRSFSYTPQAGFIEEFLLHSSSWFYWGVSLTFLEMVLLRSFSYTPWAGFSEEFLLHSSSWFYWGVSLTLLKMVLVRSFSYTPRAGFSEEFLLHSSSWFYWGVSLTLSQLVLMRSFCYTPRDGFSEEFLLHSSSWF